jgi:oligoendopeptidase F
MNDLQEKYTWDTSLLYPSPESAELEEDFSIALEQIQRFRNNYFGKVSFLDGAQLSKAITELEAIHNHNINPESYTYLIFAADSNDVLNQKLSQRGIELANKAEQELLFFELEINELTDEIFQSLVQSEHLQQYKHYLQGMRKFKPHLLSEQEERLLKQKSLTGIEAFTRFFDELTSSFSFRMEIDGAEKELTGEELLGLLHHSDAAVREKAFTVFLTRFQEESITYSTIINTIALDHQQERLLRNYSFPMEPTHLANELTNDSVTSLMKTTEMNYWESQGLKIPTSTLQLIRQISNMHFLKHVKWFWSPIPDSILISGRSLKASLRIKESTHSLAKARAAVLFVWVYHPCFRPMCS